MTKSTVPAPFTVIGGFLGSGKTTLLNHLLAEPSGVRYAVLVNDFGELNIDEALVNSHDGQTISLTNGCVCCSIANDFIETIINLVNRIDEFDQIIVEASGVSEPDRIMDIARLDPELIPSGIVVLVDAAEVRNRFDDPYVGSVVHEQLRTAELLIVNKIDLVSDTELIELERWLEQVAPSVIRLKTSEAKIPPSLFFGQSIVPGDFTEPGATPEKSKISKQNDHLEHPPVQSISLLTDTPIDRTLFEKWSKSLPPSVIRGKGILCFQEDPEKNWIWQKVGRQITIKSIPLRGESQDSKILLIGTKEMPSIQAMELPEGFEGVSMRI